MTRQSKHTPIPHDTPRGSPRSRVRRQPGWPRRVNAAAMVMPAGTVHAAPSTVTLTCSPPPGHRLPLGHWPLSHETASANRPGRNGATGSDGSWPDASSAISCPVAGASPTPAPS